MVNWENFMFSSYYVQPFNVQQIRLASDKKKPFSKKMASLVQHDQPKRNSSKQI